MAKCDLVQIQENPNVSPAIIPVPYFPGPEGQALTRLANAYNDSANKLADAQTNLNLIAAALNALLASSSASLPSTIVPDAAASIGASLQAARADHVHAIVASTPGNIAAGAVAAEGVSTAFARADHVHGGAVIPVPSSTTPAAETAGAAGTVGSGVTYARADHIHPLAAGTPGTIQPDDGAAAGAATSVARSDHQHAIVCATAVSTGAGNAEGSSTSFARADHTHAMNMNGTSLTTGVMSDGSVLYRSGSTMIGRMVDCVVLGNNFAVTTTLTTFFSVALPFNSNNALQFLLLGTYDLAANVLQVAVSWSGSETARGFTAFAGGTGGHNAAFNTTIDVSPTLEVTEFGFCMSGFINFTSAGTLSIRAKANTGTGTIFKGTVLHVIEPSQ